MRQIEVITIEGPIGYAEMLERQRARRAEVENGDAPNTLFLLEHTPTITRGRNASKEHVLAPAERLAEMGVEVHDVDRGGGVTYHGPGQLVAYPVLNLHEWDRSIGWYLRTLEQVLIDLLAGYRIESQRVEGFTGVWTAQGKIAAIGIGIHHWITYHGLALNVFTNMEHFRLIVPCGIADRPVASLQQLMLLPPHMPKAREDFSRVFMRHFA
jgi:lipoyl(octanoyl) transferase